MSETLSFPGLGLELQINPVAFTVFGRPIYWYGIMFALAFLLAAIYVLRRVRLFGVDDDRMIDVLMGGVVGGVIGARLYYVAFTWDTYKNDLLRIFKVWEGGIAMYGSIIGALIAIWFMCKWRKVKFLPLLDLFAGGLILAQAIGRWGNFFNMEAFGSNTGAAWGMTSPTIQRYLTNHQASLESIGVLVDPMQPVHPTFFYESLWCLAGFVLLAWYAKRRRYDGEMTLIYFGWYGLGRFFIEGLRTDPLTIGTLRISQIVALLCFLGSIGMMLYIHRKIKQSDDPEYLQLYVDTPEGQEILAGTFYKDKEEADEKGDEAAGENKDKPSDGEDDGKLGDEAAESAASNEVFSDSDPSEDDDGDSAEETQEDAVESSEEPHEAESAESDPKPTGKDADSPEA